MRGRRNAAARPETVAVFGMILEGRNKEKKDLPTLFMKIDALEKRIKTHEKSQDSMAETAKKIMEKMDELQNLMEPADN